MPLNQVGQADSARPWVLHELEGLPDIALSLGRGNDGISDGVLCRKALQTFSLLASRLKGPPSEISREVWDHCLAVAWASRRIAETVSTKLAPTDAFLAGLLHDVGKLALSISFPKAYGRVVGHLKRRGETLCDAEQQVFGIDHTAAGYHLAQHWRLPEIIADCIYLHHQEPSAWAVLTADSSALDVVHVANAVARASGIGFSGAGAPGNVSAIASRINLSSSQIEEIRAQLPEGLIQLAAEIEGGRSTVADPIPPPSPTERMNEKLLDLLRRSAWEREEFVGRQLLSFIADMAAGTAHELNTPLAVIHGRAQMELQRAPESPSAQVFNIIKEQAQRASNVVSDLMAFAKPAAPQPRLFNVLKLIEAASQRCRKRWSLEDQQVSTTVLDARSTVFADPGQLDEILDALLANAVEACDRSILNVQINSTARASDETARMEIVDNGKGLSVETLERAAVPFFSERPAGRGRGLGLSRAVRLTELNGGTLRLESTPGVGTRAIVELPAGAPRLNNP